MEILTRAGFKEGEIGDAFVTMGLHPIARGSKLLGPETSTLHMWKFFLREIPEYRDFAAFAFVYTEFCELARSTGQAGARIDRSTLIARAISQGISEVGIETQDHPAGLPDLRPEEARDAKQTAELVVRNVLDWLDKFPPDQV